MADRRCAWSSKCGFCSAAHHLLSGIIADKKSGSVADRKLAWISECGLHSAAQHLLSGSIADRRCSWSSECGFCSAAHHMHTAVYKAWQTEDADGAHGDVQLKIEPDFTNIVRLVLAACFCYSLDLAASVVR